MQKSPPYFYSRLKSRMERNSMENKNISILSKQRIQYALLTAMLFISIFLGIVIGNSNSLLYGTDKTSISGNEIETVDTDYLSFVENELFEEQYFKLIGHEE
ncbi:hypothetical protein ACFLRI_04030 [Bacteroidota bacterium]